MQKTKKTAFSLIELLAAIAIIAILAAILIPAVSGIRSSAKRIQTISNLKQLGTAFGLYTADHQNSLPYAYQSENSKFGRAYTNWMLELGRGDYLGQPDKPDSNSAEIGLHEFSVLGSPVQRSIYPAPSEERGEYNTFSANWGLLSGNFDNENAVTQVRINSLVSPARTMLVCEGSTHGSTSFNTVVYPGVDFTYPDKLKDGQVSVLYADGHTETILIEEFPSSSGEPYADDWNFWVGRE